MRYGTRPTTQVQDKKAMGLYRSGMLMKEVAAKTGLTYEQVRGAVRRWRKKRGANHIAVRAQ